MRKALATRIEKLEAVDPLAERVQEIVRDILPSGSAAKDALSGTWLGHPLHPALTDVVVGSWTSAIILDCIGGRSSRPAVRRLIGVGIAASIPTAASGASDWSDLLGSSRRLGAVHAIGNTTALALQSLSLAARRRGHHGRGVALSALGFGAASASAWLGGDLSFAKGVGVNQTAFEDRPSEWTAVLDESQLESGTPMGVRAGDVGVLLVQQGGRLWAMADRCAHRGCSLSEGRLDGNTIVCPCHGSVFALDGTVVHGPATSDQPPYEARIRNGAVEVRSTPAGE
jgi:nitrite reductase/ring-hydroxylating ferredoxin subunit